jgi:beta-RFAP synthase
MVRVQTASRLHFGVLSLSGAGPAGRRFGGVGLMVRRPGLCVRVDAAPAWSATGPLAERALAFAHRFAQAVRQEGVADPAPRHLVVETAAPEHAGLGTGTQLGLAVGRALAASWGLAGDVAELARRVGRGRRSALGAHGFALGGFLVEAGKGGDDWLAPLVARLPFPESWRVLLVLPAGEGLGVAGLHGAGEAEAFARLAALPAGPERSGALCRLVLLGLLPGVAEHDLGAFGEALYEFNVRVGEAFAAVQGGVYAGPRVAEVVAFVRGQGVRGVGQSSWGPTVFAVVADEEQAAHLAGRVRDRFALGPEEVLVTAACNHGATVARN